MAESASADAAGRTSIQGNVGGSGSPQRGSRWRLALLVAAVAVLAAVIVRAAWLCDDSYITLRTVDNFVHGYGLRWNVGERVQSFTSPLWMWSLVPLQALTGRARVTLFGTSFFTMAVALVLAIRWGRHRPWLAAAIVLSLAFSKAFVEYSSSGLEEPLLFVLLGLLVSDTPIGRRATNRAVFLGGLLFLTRMDAALIAGPLVLRVLVAERRQLRWKSLALAASPVVLWLMFAIFYYGVPFPNTAYAKLGHGIARSALAAQGLRYLGDFLRMDPAGSALILIGFLWCVRKREWWIPAGAILWVGYLIWIGGDFMSGRMLAPLVWTFAVVLIRRGPSLGAPGAFLAIVAAPILGVLGAAPAFWGMPPHRGDGRTSWRVTDERLFYYPTTGLLLYGFRDVAAAHPWPARVLRARDAGQRVLAFKWVGFAGYFAGPGMDLVDEYGLTDALIARLPADPDWAPGHFHRQVPEGYIETLADGRDHFKDEAIGRYFARLAIVTRGDLLNRARLGEIVWLNLHNRVEP